MSDDIPLADNFEPAPGVDYGDTVEPTEPKVEDLKVEETPETPVNPESTVEPAKPETVVEPVAERPKKATPIASLLEKKHELETQLETERAEKAELLGKLNGLAQTPASSQATDKVKQLAETYGLDETLLSDIINTARESANPELPKEVQDLLAERAAEKQQQEELTSFNTRVDSLAKALPSEMFSDPQVREKLLSLAYSTEKAPDGEPYYKKELSELYFAYIKPEVEPGKTSAETSGGGTQASVVMDFEEIFNRDDPKDIDNMDSETFQKYQTWIQTNKESKTPIKRS